MNLRTEINPSSAVGALRTGRAFDLDNFAAAYGGVTVSTCRAGSLIYRQGEPADAIYCLQSGQIQISVVSSQGREGIIDLLEARDWCGEGCLLGKRRRVGSASCIADSVVARLERASVIRGIRQNPAIAEFFVALTMQKVVQLRESLISQLFDSSERRLARSLMVLANNARGGVTADHVIRNIDQESLAQMIGSTRSRVNHFMTKFRRLGYIDYEGSVIVVRRALANIAHQDGAPPPDDEIAVAC
jgi:CRP/FNR family transcriptional regulator, cyclic AMP receptor protein